MAHVAPHPEPAPVLACTISRDVQTFDLLIEDMEASLGERWGDLGFAEALAFLDQPDAEALEFVALALDAEDEADLGLVLEIIGSAKRRGVKVILIAEDVSPASLHRLLREGGDEFVPYPLPEGELARAIKRATEGPGGSDARRRPPAPKAAPRVSPGATDDRSGVVIPVYGMAGGTGATTLAVNLAWELATVAKGDAAPRVCLLDLGLQSGSVATFLDLAPARGPCWSPVQHRGLDGAPSRSPPALRRPSPRLHRARRTSALDL
jgi:pilus assembly protein CpaE